MSVFKDAATGYSAFNLRDPYYREMAQYVIKAAKVRLGRNLGDVVEIGPGIGISTMEILKYADSVIAIEPDESMRHMCRLNTMGDPRVVINEGRGENLDECHIQLSPYIFDSVFCCQVFQIFHKPDGTLVQTVLKNAARLLKYSGVFAFDLGPSNYEFSLSLADCRSGKIFPGQIMTELAHPMYQRAHALAMEVIKGEFPDFNLDNLWPPAKARMNIKFLRSECQKVNLDLQVKEYLSPVSGERVINFIRNGWTVFFRWGQAADLPHEKKLFLMNKVLNRLFQERDFEDLKTVESCHPTAVFTAKKTV